MIRFYLILFSIFLFNANSFASEIIKSGTFNPDQQLQIMANLTYHCDDSNDWFCQENHDALEPFCEIQITTTLKDTYGIIFRSKSESILEGKNSEDANKECQNLWMNIVLANQKISSYTLNVNSMVTNYELKNIKNNTDQSNSSCVKIYTISEELKIGNLSFSNTHWDTFNYNESDFSQADIVDAKFCEIY